MQNYLDELNPQQRAAVEYCDGPSLVIAGAGSGKTRVLTYKIVHLLNNGCEPYRILALTFTNKAAREMKSRIEQLVGPQVSSRLWMGTFHSIFARILRFNAERIGFKHDFTIYDASDSKSLIKMIIKDMQLDDKVYKPSSIQAHISNMKNALISPENYANNTSLRKADEAANRPMTYAIYRAYWNRCRVAGAMDFDDLLFYTNILLRDCPDLLEKYSDFFQYILVDEYQDTNFAQHLIVLQLAKMRRKLCVVGDDAQSIYSFRGANISNILDLEKSYPDITTFKLEQNYRSTQNIIEAANSLIAKNRRQIPKHIFSNNERGSKIQVIKCLSEYEEAFVVVNTITRLKSRQGDSYEDFAVLYRTNAQSRALENALRNGGLRNDHGNTRMGIPYRIYGGLSFYQRKEVKDIISYFRMCVNPNDDEALQRIINFPSRGIGDTTVSKIRKCAMDNNVSLWNVINSPDLFQLDVNKGTAAKIGKFKDLINGFISLNSTANAHEVAQTVFERTQILALYAGDNTPENISRIENLQELMSGVVEFVSQGIEEGRDNIKLTDFLAEVSLLTDQDNDDTGLGECVTLMTVHAAKGLEYKNIIITGVEDDLFPSALSATSQAGVEEERRLLYVAITRAKTNCVMTYATTRYRNGKTTETRISRFIRDIDPQYLIMPRTEEFGQSRIDTTVPTTNVFRKQSPTIHTISNRPTRTFSTTSRPISTPDLSKRTVQLAPQSGATIHTASEVSVGTQIVHTRFGNGTITGVDTSGPDEKITVTFEQMGQKTLLLKFAKFQIIS